MAKSKYRTIETKPFLADVGSLSDRDCGAAPMLKWIKITDLVIDPDYQRDLLRTGRKNIVRIALNFDWSKFSTVIVAAVEGGQFAIVDGQHRTTAAALRGIEKVPCQIIVADRKRQAAAFAAINAAVTAMSSLQIHAAKVISGDRRSAAVAEVCKASGVTICRYPVPADKMKVGETISAACLYSCLERFGHDTLSVALQCITKTRDGNVGLVRAPVVKAFCTVLDAEPSWRSRARDLLAALQSFDLRGAFRRARSSDGNLHTQMVVAITDHLSRTMKAAA